MKNANIKINKKHIKSTILNNVAFLDNEIYKLKNYPPVMKRCTPNSLSLTGSGCP